MKIRFPYRRGRRDRSYVRAWEGVVGGVSRRYKETSSDAVRTQLAQFMTTLPCGACKGARLRMESLAVTVGGRSIGAVGELSISEARTFFESLPVSAETQGSSASQPSDIAPLSAEIAGPILKPWPLNPVQI